MTTPTNEAGHGLPEVAAAREVIRAYFAGELDDTMILNLSESLALSRGVPADMVLVPREPTEAMLDAADTAGDWGYDSLGGRFDNGNGDEIWAAMIKAAPAAAGAQGEDEIDRAARRMGDSARSLLQDIAQQAAPQPAAADGGVRERAREILAGEVASDYPKMARALVAGKSVESYVLVPHCLRAIEAALSSHRQAGEPVAFVFHELTGEVRLVWYSQNAMHNPPPSGTKLYTTPPPGPDLSKFRELAERWRISASVCGETEYSDGARDAFSECATAVLALVEKGAGS